MKIALMNQIIDQLIVFPLNPVTHECYTFTLNRLKCNHHNEISSMYLCIDHQKMKHMFYVSQ